MQEKPGPGQTEMDSRPPRAEAALGRGKAALDEVLFRAYLKNLKSPSARMRRKGAMGLGELGPTGRAAVPELEELLGDREEKVRTAAAEALARLRSSGAE
jgi:HEAT repeat protein